MKVPWWIIPILGFLIYVHSLNNQFVIDDPIQIQLHKAVHSIDRIPSLFLTSSFGDSYDSFGIYYKPIMTTFYTLIYSVFGNNPFPFHLVQLIFHILNSILMFVLFKKFFTPNLSIFLAIIFLVHPINTESVVYISALQDVLFFFFGMLGLLIITKDKQYTRSSNLTPIRYTLYPVFMALSVLSKETGILFLAISSLFRIILTKSSRIRLLLTSAVIAVIYLLVHHLTVGFTLTAKNSFPMFSAPLFERLISIPKMSFYYLKTFFHPLIIPGDQEWVVRTMNWPNFYLPLLWDSLFLAVVLGIGVYLWRRKTDFRLFLFFAIWFTLGLGFHMQIIPLDATTADRWFYLPMVGMLGMIGVLVDSLKKRYIKIITIIIVITTILLSVRSFIRASDWKDDFILASHDIQYNPDNFALENLLGFALMQKGQFDNALPHIKKSTELAPWPESWNNLGIIYRHKGETKLAEDSFVKAINLSNSYIYLENFVETIYQFEGPESTKLFLEDLEKKLPLSGPMLYWLSLSDFKLGDRVGAIEAAKQAVEKDQSSEVFSSLYQALLSNQPIELVKPKY